MKETNHDYYCEYTESDYTDFNNWQEAIDYLENVDKDLNLLFRFDIKKSYSISNSYDLQLHFAKQRHGNCLWHVLVSDIKDKDIPEIKKYLAKKKKYLDNQWTF